MSEAPVSVASPGGNEVGQTAQVDTPPQAGNNGDQLQYAEKFNELLRRERQQTEWKKKNKPFIDGVELLKSGKWKENPSKVLELLGAESFDDIASVFNPKTEAEPTQDDILGEIRQRLDSQSKEFEEWKQQRQAEKEDQAVTQFKEELKANIDGHEGSDFDGIKALGLYDAVYDHINDQYRETGEIISATEAAKHVEEYATNTIKEQIEKLREIDKFKEYFQPPKQQSQSPASLFSSELTTAPNEIKVRPAAVDVEPSQRMLSDEESKARVARLLRWNS